MSIRIIDEQNRLIGDNSSAFARARVAGLTSIFATGSTNFAPRARTKGATAIDARGSARFPARARVAGSSSIEARGRILDSSVFAAGIVLSRSTIRARGRRVAAFGANVRGKTRIKATGSLGLYTENSLILSVSILPTPGAARFLRQTAKLEINGSHVPIRSAQIVARANALGFDVSVDLSNPELEALESIDEIIFSTGEQVAPGGAIVWTEEINTGKLAGRSYSTSFSGRTLSLSVVSGLNDRLELAPRFFASYYDPQTNPDQSEQDEKLADETGFTLPSKKVARPGLSLYDAFNFAFVEGCGFSGFETNIPNYPVAGFAFSPLETFLDSVGGLFGQTEPLILERSGRIVILEKTSVLPAGFAPLALPSSEFIAYSETIREPEPVDGLVVSFVVQKPKATNFIQKFESDENRTGATESLIENEFRDYYDPNNVEAGFSRVLKSTKRTTRLDGAGVISIELETYNFDSQGNNTGLDKETRALVPLPSNNFEGALTLCRTEQHRNEYKTVTSGGVSTRELARATVEIRAILATDKENQYLEADFVQEVLEAHRAGNLTKEMKFSPALAPVKTIITEFEDVAGGQVKTTTRTVDHLRKIPIDPVTETRPGSRAAATGTTRKTGRIILWKENADKTAPRGARLGSFGLGEMPREIGLPLAKRRLARMEKQNRSGSIEISGFNRSIRRGSTFQVIDRGSNRINALVLAYSTTFADLGTLRQKITTALDLTEI